MLTWNRNLSVPSVYFIVPIKLWLMASVTLFASLEVLIGRKLDVTNVTVEPHVQRQNLLITPPMLKQKLDSKRLIQQESHPSRLPNLSDLQVAFDEPWDNCTFLGHSLGSNSGLMVFR